MPNSSACVTRDSPSSHYPHCPHIDDPTDTRFTGPPHQISMAPSGSSVWEAEVFECKWPDHGSDDCAVNWCGDCHAESLGLFSTPEKATELIEEFITGAVINWRYHNDIVFYGIDAEGKRYSLSLCTIDEP